MSGSAGSDGARGEFSPGAVRPSRRFFSRCFLSGADSPIKVGSNLMPAATSGAERAKSPTRPSRATPGRRHTLRFCDAVGAALRLECATRRQAGRGTQRRARGNVPPCTVFCNHLTSPHPNPPRPHSHHPSPSHLTSPLPTSPHLTSPLSFHPTPSHLTSLLLTAPHPSTHPILPWSYSPHLIPQHPASPHVTSCHLASRHVTSPHFSSSVSPPRCRETLCDSLTI